MKSLLAFAFLVGAVLLVAEAHPQRGRQGGRGGGGGGRGPGGQGGRGPPGGRGPGGQGGPPLSDASKTNITNLATSVNNATLTTALNSAVTNNNRSQLVDLLIQVAAGNVGGVQADWDQAQVILIGLSNGGVPGFGGGDHSGEDSGENSRERGGGRGPGGRGSGGPGRHGPPGGGMGGPMIPIRVAVAKLDTYLAGSTATQAQKDIAATLKTAFTTWQTATQAAFQSGTKPNLSDQVARDTVLAEAVRKAADDLKNSSPSFTALYDAIPQSRDIARDWMATMLDIYQANLTSTGITELATAATEIQAWRTQFISENGASTAMINSMVTILTNIQTTINNNISTTTDTTKKNNLKKLKHITDHMLEMMTAMAPYGDRLKAALNGS